MSETELSAAHAGIADRFFGAPEEGSEGKVLECYAHDAIVWHNFDMISMSPTESLGGVRTLFENFPMRKYIDVRRLPTPKGFVQQHVLRLTRGDGVVIDWPACIVFELHDGKITLLEEYVDLSALSAGS